ncbi:MULTISPECIES: hypothetical protein [Sphingobacterium]|uniref:hypothetical protein n=1 Tax=Sphingobacterium TaxID=28453 RepID=UPI0013DAF195|nr:MULTISPECIES: hypothetical protein [unclassified Sphingobacterium]
MAKNTAKGASKKAQMNSLIDNMVANAGTSKGTFTFNLNIVEAIIAEFIEWIKTDINAVSEHVVTGSIGELSVLVNNMNEYQILGMEHLIYQSRGVNGTQENHGSVHSYTNLKPPLAPVIAWIKEKQLITRNNGKFFQDPVFEDMTDDDKINALAGAIRMSIYKKGYKGKGYWDKNVDRLKQELNTRVKANLGEQIKFYIFNQYGDNVHKKK